MAKKNNLKSVRLSDQVMDYVINFEGDGFNQKFENLVLFCMEQNRFLFAGSKSFFVATRIFAPGYKRKKSLPHCSSKWLGTT